MIRLRKLYSEDDLFRGITFHDGINLILGDNSVNDDGETLDKHQNGVGKSLSVELIDFCLARRVDQSRIPLINDEYLPKSSFVLLEFECDAGLYRVGRNKKGEFKIQKGNEEFKKYGYEEAKSHLKILVGLGVSDISLRDYFNFFIKQETYDYSSFNELYRSAYIDLMKVHFFLFDIDLKVLERIKKAFDVYDAAYKHRAEVNKWLKTNNLKIDQLRARKNDIEQRVTSLEDGFDYEKILGSLEDKQSEIAKTESEINEFIAQRGFLQVELSEIEDYIDEFKGSEQVDDSDIHIVFEKYKTGLGDIVKKDLESLYSFRDQLVEFKSELTSNKRAQLKSEIEKLSDNIRARRDKVQEYYSTINDKNKNHIVQSFRAYKDDVYDFRQYDQQVEKYDEAKERLNDAQTNYSLAANELSKIVSKLKEAKTSFGQTFVDLHEKITGSAEASFTFDVNLNSGAQNKKDFFKFHTITETAGSMGSNHLRAALYDMALHINTFTKKKTLGMIVHDNLIFGLLDKASSIKYLNSMNTILGDSIQYIAAVNSDDFNYAELLSEFDFEVKDSIAIHLTKKAPLFKGIYKDFTS